MVLPLLIAAVFFFLTKPSFVFDGSPPQITNAGANPALVPPGTPIFYTLTYQDADGDTPTYVRVITRDWTGEMRKISGDYKTGAFFEYQWIPKQGEKGSEFYFEASDGQTKARFPLYEGGTLAPPTVISEGLDQNKVYLFKKDSNLPLEQLELGRDTVINAAISADGSYWAAKTGSHIYFFSKDKSTPLWKYTCSPDQGKNLDIGGWVAISEDGNYIAGGCQNSLHLFVKESNQPLWSFSSRQGNYISVYNTAISRNGDHIVLGTTTPDNGGQVFLFSKESGQPLWQYKAAGNVHGLAISSDGNYIAAGTHCPDRKAYLFSRENANPLFEVALSEGSPVWASAISSDGKYAYFGLDSAGNEGEKSIFLFTVDKNEPIKSWTTGWWVRSLSTTPDGKYLLAGSGDHKIYLFDKDKDQPIFKFEAQDRVGSVAISADGQYFVAGSKDKKVYLLSKDKKEPLWTYDAPLWITAVAISADGNYLVAGTGLTHYLAEGHNPIYSPEKGTPRTPEQTTPQAEKSPVGQKEKAIRLPGMIFGFGLMGSILGLLGYFSLVKFNLLKRPPEKLLKYEKRIIIALIILTGTFLVLTLIAVLYNHRVGKLPTTPSYPKQKQIENQTPAETEIKTQTPKEAVSGNGICEPGLGENKQICPGDCSGEN